MVKFNKYVEIGEPAPIFAGAEAGMLKVAQKYNNVVLVHEDIGSLGTDWFKKNAPYRIVECGIAEANASVIAAGLAAEGYTPYILGFTFAVIGRAYNQLRQSVLIDHFNVKIMGREMWGEMGISHNVVEGIGSLRVLPNLVILCPADIVEAEKAFVAMGDYIGPVFYRMESQVPPRIFNAGYPFEIGKAYTIKDGKDATIIATGFMVSEAIKAIDILEKKGLDIGIINMSTLKPLDEKAIIRVAKKTGAIVTAENGSIIGGLGDGVGSVLLDENVPAALVRIGIEDEFSQSARVIGASKDDLMIHHGLTTQDLVSAVKDCITKREKFNRRKK